MTHMTVSEEVEMEKRRIYEELGMGGTEEAVRQAILSLTSKDKIRQTSFLKPGESLTIARMYVMAKRHPKYLGFLKDVADILLETRCSELGMRSEQLVKIAVGERETQKAGKIGWLTRFIGGKKEEKGGVYYE